MCSKTSPCFIRFWWKTKKKFYIEHIWWTSEFGLRKMTMFPKTFRSNRKDTTQSIRLGSITDSYIDYNFLFWTISQPKLYSTKFFYTWREIETSPVTFILINSKCNTYTYRHLFPNNTLVNINTLIGIAIHHSHQI